MIIRSARTEDWPFIRELRISAYEPYSAGLTEKHYGLLKKTLTAGTEQAAGAQTFIAEVDGKLVGSVVLFPSKSKAYEWAEHETAYPEIRMLAVDPNFRGTGIGKALLSSCIQQAQKDQAPFIGLHTADYMTSALSLYGRFGFERVPELDFTPLDDGIIVKAFRLNL